MERAESIFGKEGSAMADYNILRKAGDEVAYL